jgi:hypothetical protein
MEDWNSFWLAGWRLFPRARWFVHDCGLVVTDKDVAGMLVRGSPAAPLAEKLWRILEREGFRSRALRWFRKAA